MTSLNSDWLIEAKSLTKNYGPHVALDNVDIQLPHGSIGLLGPNGAGKSTLIKTLLGLIQITSGEGTVLGHDIRSEGDTIRSKIGYMAEYDTLNPDLSAVDQVRYSGELLGMSPVVANQRTHEVMEYVGLRDQRYRKIGTFSTGMQQSTKLACAIIHDPEVLILDEPTVGIDPLQVVQTKELIRELGQKRTILLSSHILPEVKLVCERVIIINKGKIVAEEDIGKLSKLLKSKQKLRLFY